MIKMLWVDKLNHIMELDEIVEDVLEHLDCPGTILNRFIFENSI